jgi:hypothetical protein
MKTIALAALLFLCVLASLASAADKSTSLSDAQAAIEANLRTSEGKAFDERMGNEFVQKHMTPLRQCKPTAGNDLGSFWILLKLDKDGSVEEVLLHPSTKLGACARDAYLKDKFPAPPHSDYWVGVYLNLSH